PQARWRCRIPRRARDCRHDLRSTRGRRPGLHPLARPGNLKSPKKQDTSRHGQLLIEQRGETMCGRITQYSQAVEYLFTLDPQLQLVGGIPSEPIGRYNVPPQSKVQLLHQDEDGLRMEGVRWGYAPFWAQGKRPPAINARVETAATSK